MKGSIRRLNYKEQEIILFDFRQLALDKITCHLNDCKSYLEKQPHTNQLIIYDLSNAFIFGEALTHAKKYFHEVKNYHYRTALIGVNQDKRVLLKSIFRSLSPPLPQVNICKTYFEAKNWLTLNTQVEAKG